VLAASALGGLFALRGRWLACSACVAAATLARPEGLFLVIPIAAIAWHQWPRLSFWARARSTAAVAAAPLALASFSIYLWRTLGDPLAWSKAERAWGRWFSFNGVYRAAVELAAAQKDHDLWLYRDFAFCALYVVLLVLALHAGVRWSWVLAAALIVLLPLESGSVTSDARFGLLALPVFWGLAVVGRRRWLDRALRVVSPSLLAAAVVTIPLHFP